MMWWSPRFLFPVLGVLFVVLGSLRWLTAPHAGPQTRTWLILGVLFLAVSAWLWMATPA